LLLASAVSAAAIREDPYGPPPAYKNPPQQEYKPAPIPYKPAPQYKPALQYKPTSSEYKTAQIPFKPAPVAYEEEEDLSPKPYAYNFGVQDDYSKSSFAKSERQDENGVVEGSYQINLPDGRVQIVTYSVDPIEGYNAVVTYKGEAVYPPEPEGGYGAYKGPGAYSGPPPQGYYSNN